MYRINSILMVYFITFILDLMFFLKTPAFWVSIVTVQHIVHRNKNPCDKNANGIQLHNTTLLTV